MEKIIDICDYSHDYDGFAFDEENCECSIYREGDKYYFCCDSGREINYEPAGTGHDKFPLTEELNLTKRELCLKYCQSSWAKTYDIHNSQDRFKGNEKVMDILEQNKE